MDQEAQQAAKLWPAEHALVVTAPTIAVVVEADHLACRAAQGLLLRGRGPPPRTTQLLRRLPRRLRRPSSSWRRLQSRRKVGAAVEAAAVAVEAVVAHRLAVAVEAAVDAEAV